MTLALMAAMPEELQALLPLLGAARAHHHAGREFHSGQRDGRSKSVSYTHLRAHET